MIFKRIVSGSKYTFAPFRLIWALLCRSSSILMTSPSLLIRRLNCILTKMMIIDYQHWYHHHHHPKLVVLWLGAIIQIASESPFFHCLASHASIFSPIVSSSFIIHHCHQCHHSSLSSLSSKLSSLQNWMKETLRKFSFCVNLNLCFALFLMVKWYEAWIIVD